MNEIKQYDKKFENEQTGKKLNLTCYSYKLEIFKTLITVIIGSYSLEKYNKFYGLPNSEAQCVNGWLYINSEIILFFKDNPKASIIAHECLHACDNVLNSIGYTRTEAPIISDEISAYLLEHLIEVVNKCIILNNEKE
jgi:hypothetical protein